MDTSDRIAAERAFGPERYSALRRMQSRVRRQLSELPRSFRTLSEWTRYREDLTHFLQASLPVCAPCDPPRSALRGSFRLSEDLCLESVDIRLPDGFCFPVHLYRRKGRGAARSPGIVVCPGYGQSKRAPDIVEVCMALARRGFVVLAMEYDGTGERADRPDFESDINNVSCAAALLGINDLALRVSDTLAAGSYLAQRSDADPERIGVTGLCQGALVVWFSMAVSDLFQAAAPVCGTSNYEAVVMEYMNRQGGWSGVSPYVFGLLNKGDLQHVAACSAPRPIFAQNNLTDLHWPDSGFSAVQDLLKNVYALYGAADLCRFRLEHAPHAYAPAFIDGLCEWFCAVLGAAR